MALSLTPEQAESLRQSLNEYDATKQQAQQQVTQQQQAAQTFKVSLPDGSQFEGTNEEVSAAFTRFSASQQTQPAPQAQVEQRQQFNQDTFRQKFVTDASEGLDYIFQTKYGYNLGAALPVIAQTLVNLSGKLDELDRGQFQSQAGISPDDYKKIQKVVTDRGWANNRQSYADAQVLLTAQGELKPTQPQNFAVGARPVQTANLPLGAHFAPQGQAFENFPQAAQSTFIPPQVGQPSGGGQQSNPIPFDIDQRVGNMSTEEIRQLIENWERQAGANGGLQ